MNEVVAAFAAKVPPPCHAPCCARHGCSVDTGSWSKRHAIVDMDCLAIPLAKGQPRCDYLFVGEHDDRTWVVPIELKSGGIGNVNALLRQLQGGAKIADEWLPADGEFEFLPVVAHRKPISKGQRDRLNYLTVSLRGKRRRPARTGCGDRLLPLLIEDAPLGA